MNTEALVHLFHIIIVGALFIYVGIIKENIPKIMFPILFYLGIIIIAYHIYKVYSYMKLGKGYWINLIHIFIIGPTLIWIGYNREKTQRMFYEILLMLGFAAIGYHGYYLMKSM